MNAFLLMLGVIGFAAAIPWALRADRADRPDPADDEWLGL